MPRASCVNNGTRETRVAASAVNHRTQGASFPRTVDSNQSSPPAQGRGPHRVRKPLGESTIKNPEKKPVEIVKALEIRA